MKDGARDRTVNDVSTMSTDRERRFEVIVRTCIDPLRGYLARRTDQATADDVLSETLSALWRRLDDVPEDAPIAWSIGVARLQLRNSERAARRRGRLIARILTVDPPSETMPVAGTDDAAEDVARAMAGLREADAELLRLWIWDELEPRQIATVLGITANAVSIRLHRAKKRFEDLYRKDRRANGHDQVKEGDGR